MVFNNNYEVPFMTKLTFSGRLIQFLFLFIVLTLSGCSGLKYNLYEMAIGHELNKAGLIEKHLDVNGKKLLCWKVKKRIKSRHLFCFTGLAPIKRIGCGSPGI